MDITYKPYIRDSAFEELTIKFPKINIRGYRSKYNNIDSTENTEEEETVPVESQIEEIKVSNSRTNQNNTKKFMSKQEFKNTLTPLYEEALISRGLNPIFAKALVAQDGLESSWGSKPSGTFNFGGIKGKGSTKRTREVINGKNVYINDSFRDFNSLEDYVNFKINLLNNSRYNAFSGSLSDFADKVAKGGYATDPNYAAALNKIILSAKNGGVLKFQNGGLTEGKEWVKNWYRNRRSQIKKNIMTNQRWPLPVSENISYKKLNYNIDTAKGEVNPYMVSPHAAGMYNELTHRVYLKEDSPSVAVHEWTHSSRPYAQIQEINKIKDLFGDKIYDSANNSGPDEYLDDPHEIYSRLMQLRHHLNADPNHVFTSEEVEKLKKNVTNQTIYLRRVKTPKQYDTISTIFDKEGNIIHNSGPVGDFQILSDDNGINLTQYDSEGSFDILDRYSTDSIVRLLNDVALNNKKENKKVVHAQKGGVIKKLLFPNLQQSSMFDIIEDPVTKEAIKTYNNINSYWTSFSWNKKLNEKDFTDAYTTLRNYGFSKDYTCAILANWFQETKYEKNKTNSKGAKYISQFYDPERRKDYEQYMKENNFSDSLSTSAKYLIYQMDKDKQYNKDLKQYNKDYTTVRNQFKNIVGEDSYTSYALKKWGYSNPEFRKDKITAFNKWAEDNGYSNFKYGNISSVSKDYNTFPSERSSNIKDYTQTGPEAVQHFHDWYENAGNEAKMDERIKYFNILMGYESK